MTEGNVERQPVESPAAWRSADVTDTTTWTISLSDEERDEIVAAAHGALEMGLSTETITRDEQGDGEPPVYPLPVYSDVNGIPRVFYIGWYIRDAQRHEEAPRLTAAQREAMQLLEDLANDPVFHVSMDFEPGDVQLLNNAKILHAREAYEDHPNPARRRHLLRLWLVAHQFSSVEATLQQGIPQRR
jgi:hypothetical protein